MSAGSASLRRGGAAGVTLVVAVALLAVSAAVVAGGRVGTKATLPALQGGTRSGYARNALGQLKPVDAQFVTRQVGRVPRTQQTTTTTTFPVRRTPPTTAPVDHSIHGAPGAIPGLAPGGWVLDLQMAANHSTVRPGDELRYRMTITNTGTEDFRGRSFILEWNTPNGTLGRNALQQCNLLPTTIAEALCASQRLVISPGLGDAKPERFNSEGLVAIAPGQQWFHDWYVEILPTNAPGTTIFNHARLIVNVNGTDEHLRTPDVVVTVVQ
ncbi:MAG TPA: hypothetical protein VHD87_05915 [Acidimicrobiales bacterium]|nr:hypothetical protein [Acidimicrobiales bacterium]